MDLKEIDTAKADYIEYLKINNYSERTIINYTLAINKFNKYLNTTDIKVIDPTNINRVLESYKRYLKNTESYADSTINQYITNLLTFLNKRPSKVNNIKKTV